MRKQKEHIMGDFIRFQLHFKVIEDLPGRVDTILHFLAGNTDLPEDFNLPKAAFFEGESWKNFARKGLPDGSPAVFDFSFDGHEVIAYGIDHAHDRKIPSFLTWMFPYFDTRERECLGSFKADNWPFPTLIVRSEKGVSVLDMDKILLKDKPVLVVPDELKIIPFPEPENLTGETAKKMFNVLKSLALNNSNDDDDSEMCDGCGECKDQDQLLKN
jgi:hypothetical protein